VEDSDARWARLEALEATDDAAAIRKEARARARGQAHAEARHPFCDDKEGPNDHSSEGNSNSSDASTDSASLEEMTSRKRVREDDKAGPSNKKYKK
jgi:hypothetical protein